jgi:hypothetical protein
MAEPIHTEPQAVPPASAGRTMAVRLLAAVVALLAGVAALIVAILLVHTVLG